MAHVVITATQIFTKPENMRMMCFSSLERPAISVNSIEHMIIMLSNVICSRDNAIRRLAGQKKAATNVSNAIGRTQHTLTWRKQNTAITMRMTWKT